LRQLAQPARAATRRSIAMQLPTSLQIEPVGQCNLRCQMCAIQFRQDGPPYGPLAFMAFDDFTALIDGWAGLEDLHLQGLGEPMMHPRFFDMVAYAAAKGIHVSTNSNLTLLNARRADACVASGMERLHVSIDGATAETYERIRVRSHLDKVIRNLGFLREAKARAPHDLPHVRMVMVIMRQNLHELPDLVRFAAEWEMEGLFVQHLCHDFGEETLPAHYAPMRDFVQSQTLLEEDPHRVAHYFGLARETAEELGVDLRLPRTEIRLHPPGTPGRKRCSWPWVGGYVSYTGDAMPCCMVSTPDRANMGNMFKEGVEDVWNGEVFAAFRDKLASDEPPDICRSCAVYAGIF
jgi:radical SAM protein with 4Fe4S-binding SPASM domain